MRKRFFLFLYLLVPIFLSFSCGLISGPSDGKSFSVMTYNAQNLFDDVASGEEYPEFVPGGSEGWSRAAYRERLERMARVIKEAAGLPDVVVLEEIESKKVIEDLAADFLPGGSYPYRLLQEGDPGIIHVGILSKVEIQETHSHRVWLDGEESRSVWEVHLGAGAQNLIIFGNHWKSKSEGEEITEPLRILAARTLQERVSEILSRDSTAKILAVGDLNEVLHPLEGGSADRAALSDAEQELSVRGRTPAISAMDAISRSAAGGAGDVRFALGLWTDSDENVPSGGPAALYAMPVSEAGKTMNRWYSPWPDSERHGSYYYKGNWEAIDHTFLSTGLVGASGLRYKSFRVLAAPFMTGENSEPLRYDTRTRRGYSDHLPLLVEFYVK